jgi:hypothetical protein
VVDTYTVEAETTLPGITGLQLEALLDPSLPHLGPGRSGNGNFILDGIRLTIVPDPEASVPVRLSRVDADHSDPAHGLRGVTGTIDADPTTGWSIWPRVGRPHRAIFQVAPTIGIGPGTRLRVELVCGQARFPGHSPGRFRLSVTNRPVPLFDARLARLKGDRERNGLTRLGAAYALLGDWAASASILERAAARPDGSTVDGFLLALAHHHLGRPDEARSDCDRAVERLRTRRIEDETRDVATQAVMTIRGLGLGEADSLLLDLVFPAEPFVTPSPL